MQALKKIFDEIDARTIEFEAFGITDDYVSTEWIKEIIRQHINNVQSNTVTEYCPHCEKEVEICWDVEEDGYQIFCPNCGKVIMLCGMCDARDGAVCDWSENGCKHSDERYAKVNNSSYISINDERLWQILFDEACVEGEQEKRIGAMDALEQRIMIAIYVRKTVWRCKMFTKCQKCGKKLTDPESMARGYGPECWSQITGEPPDSNAKVGDEDEISGQMNIFDFPEYLPDTGEVNSNG